MQENSKSRFPLVSTIWRSAPHALSTKAVYTFRTETTVSY